MENTVLKISHNDRLERYKEIFLSTFELSACTFGGGFVIVPLMREKFVKKLHWIEEDEMLDLTAIAQSSPGAIAVNAAILVGYHIAGISGAAVAMIGTVLPPFLIISIISLFYIAFRDSFIVNIIMAGMLAGVAAVITNVVIDMTKDILKQKRLLPVVVLIASFIAAHFFDVSIILIILICGIIGAIDTIWSERRTKMEQGAESLQTAELSLSKENAASGKEGLGKKITAAYKDAAYGNTNGRLSHDAAAGR